MSSGTSTSSDTDVVICSPLRTPVGRMGGALAPLTVTDLARGDLFFGVRAHTEAAVTFLAIEAWQAAAGDADPVLARRNIVVRGLELDPLRGVEFEVDTGDGPIRLRGRRPAHPCSWMDTMVGDGVRKALIGRGGLRAQPLTSGVLRVGPAVITADVDLDAARAADQVRRAQPL